MEMNWTSAALWLARSALGATILLVLGLVLMKRTGQPARRQRLGELTVIAALAVSLAALSPGWINLPWLQPEPVTEQHVVHLLQPEPEELEALVELGQGPLPVEGQPKTQDQELPPDLGHSLASRTPAEASPLATRGAATVFHWLLLGIVAAYLVGAILFCLRWLLGFWAIRRILRHCRPAPSELNAAFAECLAENRTRPLPRLLVSSRVRAPISFGLVRPTVVVPEKLASQETSQNLHWVFVHELTHLQRRDALSAVLFAIGQALFFYLPWFWWLKRQVRLCQEYVADAAAAPQDRADEYAQFLLGWTTSPAVPLGAAGVSGNTSDLFRRISMLLRNRQPVEKRCPRWWTILFAGGLLALGLVLGGVSFAAAEADPIIIIVPSAPAPAVKPLPDRVRVVPIETRDKKKDVIVFRAERVGEGETFLFQIDGDKLILKGAGPFGAGGLPGKEKLEKDVIEKKVRVIVVPKGADSKPAVVGRDAIELEFHTLGAIPAIPAFQGVPAKAVGQNIYYAQSVDVERLRKLIDDLKKNPEKMKADEVQKEIAKALEKAMAARFTFTYAADRAGDRLGLTLTKPNEVLAEHLNLKKGSGLMVTNIRPGSPAEKAGIKVNDIILNVNDQSVADSVDALSKLFAGLKPGTAASVLVLRRGKEETVQGLKIPEPVVLWSMPVAPPGFAPPGFTTPVAPAPPIAVAPMPGMGGLPGMGGPLGMGGGVMTTTFRKEDRFTTRHQEGSLIITVTGKVADGKANVDDISVQDGAVMNRYDSLEKVPAAHRDKVQHLIAISGGLRVEKKTR